MKKDMSGLIEKTDIPSAPGALYGLIEKTASLTSSLVNFLVRRRFILLETQTGQSLRRSK